MMPKLGDTIRFRYEDDINAPELTIIICRPISDKEASMADETEFYIEESFDVTPTDCSDAQALQCMTYATDGKVYLDGRPITVERSQ